MNRDPSSINELLMRNVIPNIVAILSEMFRQEPAQISLANARTWRVWPCGLVAVYFSPGAQTITARKRRN